MTEKGLDNYALRVFVSGGGCSGLSYGMTFSEGPEIGDQVFNTGKVQVVASNIWTVRKSIMSIA
jgi:Fe-S cluster assembly iron-binding protein IscA